MGVQFEEEKYSNYRGSQSSDSDFFSKFLIKTGLVEDMEKARKIAFFVVLFAVIISGFFFIKSLGSDYQETTETSDYYMPAE